MDSRNIYTGYIIIKINMKHYSWSCSFWRY